MNEKHTKNYFKGRKLVIATKHEKEKVIAPILERELGVQISVPIDFDTDKFGTFTRDIKRIDNQLETARAKARAGIDLNSVDLAASSEGSFGSHPEIPWVSSNFELVLLLDTLNNIEIRGHSRSVETNLAGQYVSSVDEAKEVAKKWGFPEHGVIVRNNKNGSVIYKGIRTGEELEKRVRQLLFGFCIFGFCIRRFFTHFSFTRKLFTHKVFAKKVFIETDMRAHMNPTRMQNIRVATEDLVKNIRSTCPQCGCPGFVIIDVKRGLLCGGCSAPTDEILAYVYACQKCAYKEERVPSETSAYADAEMCERCNP